MPRMSASYRAPWLRMPLAGLWLAVLGLSYPLTADTITLRTGETLQGTIVGQSPTQVRIRSGSGVRVVQKTAIRRIKYSNPEADQAAEAQRREAARRAQESRRAEAKKAADLRKAEDARKREDARRQEERRKQQELERQKELTRANAERKRLENEKENARRARSKQEAADRKSDKVPETKTAPSAGVGRLSMAWRSAVLPGWGNYHAGQKWTGAAYLSLFVGAGAYAAGTRSSAGTAKRAYDQTATFSKILPVLGASYLPLALILDSQAKSAYDSKVGAHNRSLGIVGAVYGIQLLHVLIFGPGAEKAQAGGPSWFLVPSFAPAPISGRGEAGAQAGVFFPLEFGRQRGVR